MTYSEVVLKIPDEKYDRLIKQMMLDLNFSKCEIAPLPKGHGDLIDVNDLLDRIGLEDCDINREDNVGEIITLEDIDFTPTIIEADKAENEDL